MRGHLGQGYYYYRWAIVLSAVVLLLLGCGQKGELYLPQPSSQAQADTEES